MEEMELIEKAKNQDMNAFRELVDLYLPVVERFAYQLGNRPGEVEDVTQEVFLRVYRFLDQYHSAKFTTWLYKITLNVTRDAARKRSSDTRKVIKLKQERQETYAPTEHQVLQHEEDHILHICIQKLDEKYRIPLVLYYFHDKKYDEIAEIMELTLSTVKTRLLRAKKLLKAAFEEEERKEGGYHG
ncbi:RNA polymerase sigma factor [Bacillus marinisedimentorum]|uniref:RNA polymerase sigma factor n=1 Tax=Bacillus marinisedimentorum TaxID=1821260 RepID=UPI000872382A|nr:RNA polymerase sigma factor [Bacillus marinisedimentorum]